MWMEDERWMGPKRGGKRNWGNEEMGKRKEESRKGARVGYVHPRC